MVLLPLLVLAGCARAPVEDPVAAQEGPDEVWLDATCDLPAQVEAAVADLRDRGVVEVVGGQPYHWEFSCSGETLDVTVRFADVPGGGDPVLWLGAATDPPRIVPIRLQVGAGQVQLEERVRRCDAGESARFHVDLATGVVWGED